MAEEPTEKKEPNVPTEKKVPEGVESSPEKTPVKAAAQQPKAEQPKAEQPKAEKPKAEKPKAEKPKADKPADAAGAVLSFDFTPDWARSTPGVTQTKGGGGRGGDRRGGDRRGGGNDRKGGGGGRPGAPRSGGGAGAGRPGDRRGGPSQGANARGGDRQGGDRRGGPREQRPPAREHLPIRADFIPDNDRLPKVVHLIRASHRAFPLEDICMKFLSQPDFFKVKLHAQPKEGEAKVELFQHKRSGMVFLSEADAQSFALEKDLPELFTLTEQEVEPPKGSFICVGRCKRGGELVGPPNYHAYQENVEALRQERYASMTPERFKETIEMVKEEELVEQWKASQSKKTFYVLAEGEPMDRAAAEKIYRTEHLPKAVTRSARCIMPGTCVASMTDARLKAFVQWAFEREQRNQFSMRLALRPALKHMHLHLVKLNKVDYITAIVPHAVDIEHAVPAIQLISQTLKGHPASTRQALLELLHPGAVPESAEAAEMVKHLSWLIEKGHVIQFNDGSMSLPRK